MLFCDTTSELGRTLRFVWAIFAAFILVAAFAETKSASAHEVAPQISHSSHLPSGGPSAVGLAGDIDFGAAGDTGQDHQRHGMDGCGAGCSTAIAAFAAPEYFRAVADPFVVAPDAVLPPGRLARLFRPPIPHV